MMKNKDIENTIENRGSEMKLHEYLKKVANLWLLNRGCFITGSEIFIPRSRQATSGLKRLLFYRKYKQFIDVCGIGIIYKSQWEREFGNESDEHYRTIIVRGIEIKTSRSDYFNGFVRSGCNYNYILTPKDLLKISELPPKLGLIEYEKDKFSCIKGENNPFRFKGLRVVKKPKMQPVLDKDLKLITYLVGRKVRPILIESLFNNFSNLLKIL